MKINGFECTGSFLLLLAWLNYIDRRHLLLQTVLACLLHELGHYLCIRILGFGISKVRLTAVGAEMAVNGPMNYWQEGITALSGPGVNFLTALITCRLPPCSNFTRANLVLGLFNLLPATRLDGGRALLATLSLIMDRDLAERAGEWLNRLFAALLLSAGICMTKYSGSITLLLVAVWLCVVGKKGKKKRNNTCNTIEKQVK